MELPMTREAIAARAAKAELDEKGASGVDSSVLRPDHDLEAAVGRKDIIAFLDPYLKLAPDPAMAWKKVRRWRIRYGLPVETQPNGKPYIDPTRFAEWWNRFDEIREMRLASLEKTPVRE